MWAASGICEFSVSVSRWSTHVAFLNGICTVREAGSQSLLPMGLGPTTSLVEYQGAWNPAWYTNVLIPVAMLEYYRGTDFRLTLRQTMRGELPAASRVLIVTGSGTWLFPAWVPALPIALGAAGLYFWGWKARSVPGHCRKCGYDRRSIDAKSPCPECGRASKAG